MCLQTGCFQWKVIKSSRKDGWDPEAERKLIEIWSDVLREMDRKIMRKKEVRATCQLNAYVEKELDQSVLYIHRERCTQQD